MRGLIETAIEREAERLDEIMEAVNHLDVPFFSPRHFRSRTRPQTSRFASRGSQRRFSSRTALPSHFVN